MESQSTMESQFTICMFVSDHMQSDNPAGLYLLRPDSTTDTEIDYHGTPVVNPLHLTNHLLPSASMFKLGSIIYFFGGKIHKPMLSLLNVTPWHDNVLPEVKLAVWAFDTNAPEAGFFSVTPLNFLKERPCVFDGHGKLYALGSNVDTYPYTGTETYSGHFECYDPESDKWKVLPDPPRPFSSLKHHNMSIFKPLVFNSHVFINDGNTIIIFNLDVEKWVSLDSVKDLPPYWSVVLYPFKPAYAGDYLYSIQDEPVSEFDPDRPFPLRIVRGSIKDGKDGDPQLVATIEEVDGHNAVYNQDNAIPRKHFYHVGHKIFCYIVDSPLYFICEDFDYHGIWIKFFKEVQVSEGRVEFRLLGSFCYKINQPFIVESIDFCFFGSLPTAWKKGVPMKQQVLRIHEHEKLPEKLQANLTFEQEENQEKEKLREEIMLLTAQLSHKKKLLEEKESLSLESKGKLSVSR